MGKSPDDDGVSGRTNNSVERESEKTEWHEVNHPEKSTMSHFVL